MRQSAVPSIAPAITLLVFVIGELAWSGALYAEASEHSTEEPQPSGVLIFPIIYYTPETKIAGGAALNYYFREQGSALDSRPSTIMPMLIYTQKKQFLSQLSADIYWKAERYLMQSYVGFIQFPAVSYTHLRAHET